MTQTNGKALEIARTYVEAIANRDVDKIISISAEDIVCMSPIGQMTGLERFRAFHDGFAQMITNLTILAVYGDAEKAVVVYDVETYPVPHAVTADMISADQLCIDEKAT